MLQDVTPTVPYGRHRVRTSGIGASPHPPELLARVPLFEDLAPEEIEWIASAAHTRTFMEGEHLFDIGESGPRSARLLHEAGRRFGWTSTWPPRTSTCRDSWKHAAKRLQRSRTW